MSLTGGDLAVFNPYFPLPLSPQSIVRGSSEDPLDTSSHGIHGGEKSGCSATEKALLLAYALKWRKRTNMLSAEQLRELEKEIWLSHIHAIVEETDESVSRVVPAGLMHVCSLNFTVHPLTHHLTLSLLPTYCNTSWGEAWEQSYSEIETW